MKFFKKISSVLLSLVLCGSMVAPAFAASFSDLQNAINGYYDDSAEPNDGHKDGTKISGDSEDGPARYGYAWTETSVENGGKDGYWGIEAWTDNNNVRNVQLNDDVTYDNEVDNCPSIEIYGDVNLSMGEHTITGARDTSVIQIGGTYTDPDETSSEPPEAGSLTITGGTIRNGSEDLADTVDPSAPKCAIHVGADAELELYGTEVTGSKDGIYAEAAAKIQLENGAKVTGTTGVDVVLGYGTVMRRPAGATENVASKEGASINTPDGGSWTDPTGKSYSGDVISSGEDLSLTWVPAGTTDPTDPDPTEPTAPGESGDTPNEAEIADPDVPMSQGPVSCAEFIHKMWVLDGEPEPLDDLGLPEGLDEDHEYASAIAWAASAGIVSRDSFDAEALLTVALAREFLTGYAAYADMAMPELTTLTGKDSDLVMNSDDVLDEFFGGKDSE